MGWRASGLAQRISPRQRTPAPAPPARPARRRGRRICRARRARRSPATKAATSTSASGATVCPARRRAGSAMPERPPGSGRPPAAPPAAAAAQLRLRSCSRMARARPAATCATFSIVLIEARREDVAAGAVGDEIEVLGLGRLQHRLDRRAPRIGDRRRRQAIDLIGVVRGLAVELFLLDGMVEHALAAHQPVDDGRVGLQPHLLALAGSRTRWR